MKSVRIYKDDIRTHILRSLFFTDTALVIVGSIIIAGISYLLFKYAFNSFNLSYYFSTVFVGIVFFIAFITQKIDNQPIYKIVPRAFTFKSSKKERRYKDLESYFTDFYIQEGCIIRKNTLIKIYEIKPHDIALLNDQDREHFFVKLKQVLHILPAQIQIIVKKEKAKASDYSDHIFSMYRDSDHKREPLIKKYTDEIQALIKLNNLVITKHYVVISVASQTNNPYSKLEGIRRLDDMVMRIISGLSVCNILVKPLSDLELTTFAKEILR